MYNNPQKCNKAPLHYTVQILRCATGVVDMLLT